MDIDPRKIDPKFNDPINRLMLAINHYISTGDNIGEGIATPDGDKVRVLIAVNKVMQQDKEDFQAFKAKFKEIKGRFKLTLNDHGSQGLFHMYSFLIEESQIDNLAVALTESPGPKGWGSLKPLIDKHFRS